MLDSAIKKNESGWGRQKGLEEEGTLLSDSGPERKWISTWLVGIGEMLTQTHTHTHTHTHTQKITIHSGVSHGETQWDHQWGATCSAWGGKLPHFPLSPWQPPFYSLSLRCDYFRYLISGIIQYLSFCDWAISFSTTSSRFVYVVSCVRMPFLFKGWLIFHGVCMPHFVYSFIHC